MHNKSKTSASLVLLCALLWSQLAIPASAASATALQLLDALTVAPESNSSTYNRALFKHWIDADKDGFDTREEVLIAESIIKAKTGKGCSLLSGQWAPVYENKTFSKASSLDVDHMVPLKEAWESGASGWSAAERQAFANDLEYAGSLIADSASTNRSKGDKDPAQWTPTNSAYKCTYAVTWVQVKYRWSPTIDSMEAKELKVQLASCPKTKKYSMPATGLELSPPTSAPTPSPSLTQTPTPTPSPTLTPSPPPTEVPSPTPSPSPTTSGLDPRFSTCTAAKAVGYGPYVRGVDPEYDWYRDGDNDGVVCE